jgi:hypothetical protein
MDELKMSESNLIFDGFEMPPESARNCVQELYPIPNGEFKKSINGNTLFLESTERRRYRSAIFCRDVNALIIEGIWIGSQIKVGCIQTLWQSINAGETTIRLTRPAVDKSVCALDCSGNPVKFNLQNNVDVKLNEAPKEKIFVCFRPWLTMKIIDFSLETNEWGMSGGWKLILEEI